MGLLSLRRRGGSHADRQPVMPKNPRLHAAWKARQRNSELRKELFQYALASGLHKKKAAYVAGIAPRTADRYFATIYGKGVRCSTALKSA